jgi:hypothetical protein
MPSYAKSNPPPWNESDSFRETTLHLVGVEVLAEPAQGGGLAAAGFAGEQAESLGLDEVAQAGVELVEHRRPEELVGGQGALEGRMSETEDGGVEVHLSSSPR